MQPRPDIDSLLACPTPKEWMDAALKHQDILLIDHANCEKKAAVTAVSLMFQYGERHVELQEAMSRVAREELRHFEQVTRLMKKRGIRHRPLTASRYAGGLRKHVRRHEPGRLVDLLIIGALIEARSAERFHALAPHLDAQLAEFYADLAAAESRHCASYIKFARRMDTGDVTSRISMFVEIEAHLIADKDVDFRFHSGPLY